MFLRISGIVVLEATFFLSLVRITPQKVEDFLVVLRVVNSKLDLEWSLDLLNRLDVLNCWSNTTMAAENSLLFIRNNSSERHLFKCFINLHKDTIWVVNILTQSLGTLIAKAKILVHMLVLMISSKKHDLLWVFELKGKQEADDLKTVLALVDVVS